MRAARRLDFRSSRSSMVSFRDVSLVRSLEEDVVVVVGLNFLDFFLRLDDDEELLLLLLLEEEERSRRRFDLLR